MTDGNKRIFPRKPYYADKDFPADLWEGLSLREYYAGLAMSGMMHFMVTMDAGDFGRQKRAEMAVKEADALIAELNKKEEK